MKQIRICLILISSFLIIENASAQFTVGIKGGLNFAHLSGFRGDGRTSGHIGLFLNHRMNPRWSIQPELLYNGKGTNYFDDGEERTIALDYISIPLMFQYNAISQLYFEFGPEIGFLASATDKGPRGDNVNVKSDFRSNEIVLNVGIGFQATNKLGFYGRYGFGLTDVSLFDNIVDHTQTGQLGVSYRLR